ncbi:MAG TPA: T9SS type A sorting domain-containing protein [Flavobacterium sp.]|uniref:T9SS type A sorting domain-containing protein n=1 Tax=Flavobacterium sp. TaxID=239 RepID=UPI002C9D6232|nr:T9SS type A sorting domain-containing protein [Flavobacterium sp.]HNP33712.1 T9SS type A sorting domain-containing protein [Flavobacterium sp.]
MKQIATFILMLYSIIGLSQTPNPNLFQTWYLYDYYSTDDNIHHPVSAINPAISPSVTFSATSNFNGMGACNAFYGNFSAPADDVLVFDNFAGTLLLCSNTEHITLEGVYFSLFQSGGQYSISGQGDAMTLVFSTPIFTNYVFGNSQLHAPNFALKQAIIYPNPADSKLFIDSQNNAINKIEILNSLGQSIKTVDSDFTTIDISDLAAGVYVIKLFSDGETACRKIIKK